MNTTTTALGTDRPRCRTSDGQGARCHAQVVWSHAANRPLSTRCEAHGGLADAVLMSRSSPDPAETRHCHGGTGDNLASALNALRANGPRRPLGGLPALVLAAGLCLAMAAPALADFESAVAAYERGSYQEAQRGFEAAADAGDERAGPYLERIGEKLRDDRQTDETSASTLMDSISSIFSETETSSNGAEAGVIVTDAGTSTAARSRESAPSGKSADWEPWSPFDRSVDRAPPPSPVSDVVAPQRESLWSTLFHLPGDVTVIGLQYVAQFLDADNLGRELQIISHHSEKITLSILTGFWWLVIIKGAIGMSMMIGRFMKAATTITEQKRYG